jgi:hypothetical protein
MKPHRVAVTDQHRNVEASGTSVSEETHLGDRWRPVYRTGSRLSHPIHCAVAVSEAAPDPKR